MKDQEFTHGGPSKFPSRPKKKRSVRRSERPERTRDELQEELALFTAGPVVVFKWKNVAGRWPLEYVSSNVSDLLGYSQDSLLTGRVQHFELLHPDDFDRVAEELQSHTVAGEDSFSHRPYRLLHRDGRAVWVENRTTIDRNADGVVTHFKGYIADITHSRQAEENLRQSRQMLRLVMDTIPVALCWKALDSTYLGCNKLFAEVAGVSGPEEIVGLRDNELGWKDEELSKARKADRRVMESDQAELFQMESGHSIQGREMILESCRIPIHGRDGRVMGVLSLFRDITEKMLLAAQLKEAQKLESLGLLAGGVAHDFNNILTTILCNADLVAQQMAMDPEALESVQQIVLAAENAVGLVEQMLTFAGGQSARRSLCQLSDLTAEVIKLLRVSVPERTTVELILRPDLPEIEADPAQIRQVVMNLLINACQAIGEGEGTIVVRTGLLDVDRSLLKETWVDDDLPIGTYNFIDVQDSGVGMSEETRSKLFDPFFTTKADGRGLGMATVLGIVRDHRGAIKVVSRLGHGSCFRVLLPAACQVTPARDLPQSLRL